MRIEFMRDPNVNRDLPGTSDARRGPLTTGR